MFFEIDPAIIDALEALSGIHPFLKVAYVPFKLIYHQETQRRDNDRKRLMLFEKIKDVMLLLLELNGFSKHDTRTTPDGKPVLSRLADICKGMKQDIEACYQALNDQESRNTTMKFFKASRWNEVLVEYATRFTNRREELRFALSLRTAVTVEEMNKNIQEMAEKFAAIDGLGPLMKTVLKASHRRVKEKTVARVWKRQGWDKTATTSKLVLGIQKYLVEQAKDARPTVRNLNEDDSTSASETDISAPVPDSWMTGYLENKPLFHFEQALDHELSGSISVTEINDFTQRKPKEWSFLRWAVYWTIGWKIFATKHCVEIENLFTQMDDLRTQMGTVNRRLVNDYIERTKGDVTALTSAIERYHSHFPPLEDKFANYVDEQENHLNRQLEKIQYNIDATKTVSEVLDGVRIEEAIFRLLALLMRRHVTKMQLGLKQELDARELSNGATTIAWIVTAVWLRYVELNEKFKDRQTPDLKHMFDRLSCGLFKGYFNGGASVQPKHLMNSDIISGEPCTHGGSPGAGLPTLKETPPGADSESWHWFLAVDEDRSGEINAEELQCALINPDGTAFDVHTVEVLMIIFDDDKNGTIDFNEFAGLRKFIENWRKIFNLCDSDHSGTIDEKELDNVLLVQFRRDLSPDLPVLLKRKYGADANFPFESFLRAVIFAKHLSEKSRRFDTDRERSMEEALRLI